MRRWWMAIVMLIVGASCWSQEVAVFTNHRSIIVQSHRVEGEWTYFRIGSGEMAVLSREVLTIKKEAVQPAPATYAGPSTPARPAPPPAPAAREPWRPSPAFAPPPQPANLVNAPSDPSQGDDEDAAPSADDGEDAEEVDEPQPPKPPQPPEVQRKPGMLMPSPFAKPPQQPQETQGNDGE